MSQKTTKRPTASRKVTLVSSVGGVTFRVLKNTLVEERNHRDTRTWIYVMRLRDIVPNSVAIYGMRVVVRPIRVIGGGYAEVTVRECRGFITLRIGCQTFTGKNAQVILAAAQKARK